MIDSDGFRPNVGIILANSKGQVLWAKRIGWDTWQFPQGGIDANETPEQALFRELKEEIGLEPHQVEIMACTRGWLKYWLPKHMIRKGQNRPCIGQKQKWFLLKFLAEDSAVNTNIGDDQEFDDWKWVSYWYPLGQIIAFKREVYRRALKELSYRHSRLVFFTEQPK